MIEILLAISVILACVYGIVWAGRQRREANKIVDSALKRNQESQEMIRRIMEGRREE